MSLNDGETNPFTISISGTHFHGRERIRIVDSFTKCGSDKANVSTTDLNVTQPNAPYFQNLTLVEWAGIKLGRQGIFRVCFCGCAYLGDPVYKCCTYGQDFYLEVAAIYVSTATNLYTPPLWTAASVAPDIDRTPHPAAQWGAVPKDFFYTYRLKAKTRDKPEHAGSEGPIHVYLVETDSTFEADSTTGAMLGTSQSQSRVQETNALFPFPIILTNLGRSNEPV